MLAVQRFSMGSSKPPNHDMPFGYSFDNPNNGYPFQAPPAPAPGPSLLNDTDSSMLSNFFNDLDTSEFNAGLFQDTGDGMGGLGDYPWNEELPPDFMGTTTSFGQHPHFMANDGHNMSFQDITGHLGTSHDGLAGSASADVLAGASMLLHNGHHNAHNNGLHIRSHSMHESSMFAVPNAASQPRSHNTPLGMGFSQHGRDMQETLYADSMYGALQNNPRRDGKGLSKPVDFQFGSDVGFATGQAFVAPQHHDNPEAERMNMLDCLEAQSSTAASTRPPSPVMSRHPDPVRKRLEIPKELKKEVVVEEETPKVKKRRKSEIRKQHEEDEEDEVQERETNGKSSKKKKPKSMTTVAAPPPSATQSPPASKRRKSTASSATKPPRENLTEDQKRENHIRSEQKRRTLIKEGFDDLGELVPDLRSGGFSKSAVLNMTGDFLQDLIEGNNELKKLVAELKGRKA